MTHPGPQASKQTFRTEFRSRLLALGPQTSHSAGIEVARLLAPVVADKRVAAFCPVGGEPEFASRLQGLRAVAYPRCVPASRELAFAWMTAPPVVPGVHGIPEPGEDEPPAAPEEFDVVLVPGAGFAPTGDRLGWGAGYYDRFLAAVGDTPLLCGIANDFQIVDQLPIEPHDVPVDMIITPTRVIHCRRNSYRP